MTVNDELIYVIKFDNIDEARRFYDQLICIPGKHRKKEAIKAIDELYTLINDGGGFEE